MSSSKRAAVASALVALCMSAGADSPGPASPALCAPPQHVVFHCALGARSVSLCADMSGIRITALEYRYGVPGRIEISYAATLSNGRKFSAAVEPLAPRASVRQLWFTQGGATYLLSQCVGGDCPQSAGLSVLRAGRPVSNRYCVRSADDRAWFAPELVRFGSDASDSRALTDLIEFNDASNDIAGIYPLR